MTLNIVDAIEAHVTPDEITKVSGATGESEGKTRAAMSTGILGIVASVIQRASSQAGAGSILDTLKTPLFGGAENLSTSFLGDHGGRLTDVIAKANGIRRPAAHGILSAALPLAASALGHEVTSRDLDADGLAELLRSQKEELFARPGFGAVAGELGLQEEPRSKKEESKKVIAVTPVVPERATAPRPRVVEDAEPVQATPKRAWLPAAVGLGVLGFCALLLARRATETRRVDVSSPVADAPRVAGAPRDQPPAPPPSAPEPMPAEPTGETTITAAELPKADDLSQHFGAKDVPDRITLTDVTFDVGSAKLDAGEEKVERLAALMKDHPSTSLRLEGHTDDVGDANANRALSAKRAKAVQGMLVSKGIAASRIQAVGLGEGSPVAPNDTDEGRAKNRRIDAVIVGR